MIFGVNTKRVGYGKYMDILRDIRAVYIHHCPADQETGRLAIAMELVHIRIKNSQTYTARRTCIRIQAFVMRDMPWLHFRPLGRHTWYSLGMHILLIVICLAHEDVMTRH